MSSFEAPTPPEDKAPRVLDYEIIGGDAEFIIDPYARLEDIDYTIQHLRVDEDEVLATKEKFRKHILTRTARLSQYIEVDADQNEELKFSDIVNSLYAKYLDWDKVGEVIEEICRDTIMCGTLNGAVVKVKHFFAPKEANANDIEAEMKRLTQEILGPRDE